MRGVLARLDTGVNVADGRDVIGDERLEPCVELNVVRSKVRNVLEQFVNLLAHRQVGKLSGVVRRRSAEQCPSCTGASSPCPIVLFVRRGFICVIVRHGSVSKHRHVKKKRICRICKTTQARSKLRETAEPPHAPLLVHLVLHRRRILATAKRHAHVKKNERPREREHAACHIRSSCRAAAGSAERTTAEASAAPGARPA